MAIRVATSGTETRAISIREAISASETREILGQGMVAPATFFDTLIARADVLTAAEFMTQTVATDIRYRQNTGTNTGTLLNEYAAAIPAGAPLLRGLSHGTDTHTELRAFGSDLTGRGGINYSDFPGWGTWITAIGTTADHGIYIIDLDEDVWYAINPHNVNSRSGGGSWANWSDGARVESWASSFINDGAANTYISNLRAATTARHMIMAVLDDHDYIPMF